MKYEKTEDPNIIRQIKTVVSEIYLDKLGEQILELRAQLSSIPEAKTKPDQETLDFWNALNVREDKEDLEKLLKEKEDLLKQLEEL